MIMNQYNEVILFYAEESLLFQVAGLVRAVGHWSLRLVSSRDPVVLARALADARVAIVDATEYPGEAMAVLERGLARLEPPCVMVYAEKMHEGLELFTRVRGAPLLLGPMAQVEWAAVFERCERLAVRSQVQRQTQASV
jgi:hypothetical protein